MSGIIRIAAEGEGAADAVEELLTATGLAGSAEPVPRATERDGGALMVVAAIAGITAAVPAVVNGLLEWRDRWTRRGAHRRISVVLEDARGNRLILERARPEDLAALLRTLPLEEPR